MDPRYHEYRHATIKSQLSEGFGLVLRYEQIVKDRAPSDARARLEHPFLAGRRLVEVSKIWSVVRQQSQFVLLVETEINKVIQWKFAEAKATISHLLLFLAAMDAVPLEYIPMVQFECLTFTESDILSTDKRCLDLNRQRERIMKAIADTRGRVDPTKLLSAAGVTTIADI
jgi:hypothetical protein